MMPKNRLGNALACLCAAMGLAAAACSDSNDFHLTPPATPTPLPSATAPGPSPTPSPSGDPIADLPVDETVALAGLTGAVDVVTDDHGVKHIYGAENADVIFVQGYVIASQRFFSMDVLRKFATGRLSELFGSLTLAMDVQNRTVFTTRDGRRIQTALHERLEAEFPDGARLGEAYAAGINAWLGDLRAGRNGATLPPEYGFALVALGPDDLAEWTVEDSLALGRLQALNLSDTMAAEIAAARRAAALPEELAADVFRFAPAADATIRPAAEAAERASEDRSGALVAPGSVPIETLDAVLAMIERHEAWNPIGIPATGAGSNNWILSGSLTASGHAIMANDPHLQLFNPPIWHMVHLSAEGGGPGSDDYLNVNGVIFPGLPGVILGHNEWGAWGATTSNWDVGDVYVEQVTTPSDYPASPRTVLFNGQQVPVLRVEERFRVNREADRTFVIEVVPHHGPMVPDPDLEDDVVGLAATAMTYRWTGHEISLDSVFLTNITRARNAAEFREALLSFATGGQNWIWADVHGDITYFPYVLVPRRPAGVIPYLPVSGTGGAEWLSDADGNTLWVEAEVLPQAMNPAEGFVASANNDPNGNTLDNDPLNDPLYLGWGYELGFRAQRIAELIDNRAGLRADGAKITPGDVARQQYDHQSKEAERLLPFLFAAAEARADLVTAEMTEALERLREWGEAKPGTEPGAVAWDMVSGVDLADVREDVAPRAVPVSDEERTDAAATSIFVGFTTRLPRLVLADDFEGTGIGSPGGQDATKALLHILEDVDRTEPGLAVRTLGPNGESTLWDDSSTAAVETRDEMLLRALADGIEFLAEKFATPDQSAWLWGLIHQARYQHFFGQGGLPVYDLYPFPGHGGRSTVDPAAFGLNSDQFDYAGGPSMRHVVELDPAGVRAINIIPGGNNGNPGGTGNERFNTIDPASDYGTHIPGWINGEVLEMRFTRGDVAASARSRVRYEP
jgi:penicillin amidase